MSLEDTKKYIRYIHYCSAQRPNQTWNNTISSFVLVITFDLSVIEGPTNTYSTATTATRTI
jgi:hypothetical protein